jgi:hypothetical protein
MASFLWLCLTVRSAWRKDFTTSPSTRLNHVAIACGYRTAAAVSSGAETADEVRVALSAPGPSLLVISTAARARPTPSPATAKLSTDELRARFEDAIRL